MKTSTPCILLCVIALICVTFVVNAQAGATCDTDGANVNQNTAVGYNPLANLDVNNGTDNTGVGERALYRNVSGDRNTAVGSVALLNAIGNDNTGIGYSTLFGGVDAGGNPISTGSYNTATGGFALQSNTNGGINVANGYSALQANKSGFYNVALGGFALGNNLGGSYNVATGANALYYNKGSNNTANGHQALQGNTSGSNNIAVGFQAGINLNTGSNNIDIGNAGVAGESGRIRIGTAGKQTDTLIAGIYGKTIASGAQVIIGSGGKLGTIQSSARYKEDIKVMEKASEAVLALKPVTFRYKKELDPEGIPQFGLIAEQVERVNPDLVVRDEDGKVMTVRYEAVNAMLLNEFLKEHRNVAEQQSTIAELKAALAKQQATNTHQQQQIEALTAGLQKVSAAVELNKSAPTQVADTR